jgi:hypothetical protein
MRRIVTFFVIIVITINGFAQSPEKMSYQAVILNSNNQLVISQTVGMQISILQGSVNGTVVYTETLTPSTNTNGLVSIEIGGGSGFSGIDWSSGSNFTGTFTFSDLGTVTILVYDSTNGTWQLNA